MVVLISSNSMCVIDDNLLPNFHRYAHYRCRSLPMKLTLLLLALCYSHYILTYMRHKNSRKVVMIRDTRCKLLCIKKSIQ